jgi:spore maturation protein CgeB
MRTFEIPAVGACMVVEDTQDHRAIFGDEGERVILFQSPLEMVEKTRLLLNDHDRRSKLREAVHAHIVTGHNMYADRLRTMMDHSESEG